MQGSTAGPVAIPARLLGKRFGAEELGVIREELRLAQPVNRAEMARRVCVALQWRSPGGAFQVMSARVALLRLHRLGLIALPAPRSRGNNENRRQHREPPQEAPPRWLPCRVDQLAALRLERVRRGPDAQHYRALLQHYHYLGYSATAGAQLH